MLDARFSGSIATPRAVELVEELLAQIDLRLEEPDAGPWELRGVKKLHSFTLLMHWAGARRAAEIGDALGRRLAATRGGRDGREAARERCWDDELGAITQAAGEPALDAALLLALQLGSFSPTTRGRPARPRDPRGAADDGGLLHRYTVPDDFGQPRAAFTVCSFWLVEALASIGRATRRARSSSTSWRSTTASGSTARTSSRTRSSRAATSRRPTATSA